MRSTIEQKITKNNINAHLYRFIRKSIIPWLLFSVFLYVGLIIITN